MKEVVLSSFYAGREEVEAFGGKKLKAIRWHAHMDITVAMDGGRRRECQGAGSS